MIDTWLFAGTLPDISLDLRCRAGYSWSGRDDQLIGVNTAITLAAGAALALSISWGNLFLLDVAIAITALFFAGTIAYSRVLKGETR